MTPKRALAKAVRTLEWIANAELDADDLWKIRYVAAEVLEAIKQ